MFGHAQISELSATLTITLLHPRRVSHSQQVTLPSPLPPNPGKPGVPFYSSSFSTPFFWKAVKMFKLF